MTVLESEFPGQQATCDYRQDADEIVVDRVLASGERDAFELIVERYKRPVMKLAFRITGNYDGSIEVAQEAFVKAWRYLRSYRKEMRFSSWLFKIATNVARDFIADRRKLRDHESPIDESAGEMVKTEWEHTLEGRIYVQHLLEKLREPYKTAIILRFMEDLSYDAIAEIMETSVEQVKNYLFRGRQYILQLAREVQ